LQTILQYLQLHGEQLDADLATELKLPLEQVRAELRDLSAQGRVMTCYVTRFREGNKIEGWSSRIAGFTPPPSPGRKPNPTRS
jgi:predicted ArsR family transcriptional regulator